MLLKNSLAHKGVIIAVSCACEEVVDAHNAEILSMRERHLDVRNLNVDGLVGRIATNEMKVIM